MPFGVVSGVGLGMGVLDFGGDRRRGTGSLGVNLRRPIVTIRTLLRRCVELRKAIENVSLNSVNDWLSYDIVMQVQDRSGG